MLLYNGMNKADRESEFLSCIESFTKKGVSACSKREALKLLKKFKRKIFNEFWEESAKEYFPAVAEGTMKLSYVHRSHGEQLNYAKELIKELDPDELARAFLYGVSNGAPEYRTALACYHYIKNLPEHNSCRPDWAKEGNECYSCTVCGHQNALSAEAKYRFWSVNTDMGFFYFTASVPFGFDIDRAVLYLEEYKRLPPPGAKKSDRDHFESIINYIDALPDDVTPSVLRTKLRESGLIRMTVEETERFIDMLGYLNILHTEDCFGVTEGHINKIEMKHSSNARTYYAYPVELWKGKHGVDYASFERLFRGLDW